MAAILAWKPKKQEDFEHLQEQLIAGGILQGPLYECAESYLVQIGIYDVIQIRENDFRMYKKYLQSTGQYTNQQVMERTAALRKLQQYWFETEFSELIIEIGQYEGSKIKLIGNVKGFLMRNGIHHLREIEYPLRQLYEEELYRTIAKDNVCSYLKIFDNLKQQAIQGEQKLSLAGRGKWKKYRNEIYFLPYHPDQNLAKDFEWVRDKQELVWDFSQKTSEVLKKQVFTVLNYILENLYPDDPKERRVRFLLPLKWLYDFCVEQEIEDIELLEQEQINALERIIEKKIVNVKNSMQIVDNSRKILFLTAKEIHWHANVWYMERFQFSQHRMNPSSPVKRLKFLDVTNRKNRKILQEYAQYLVGITDLTIGNIRSQLYEVKNLLQYFKEEVSIYAVTEEQLDQYFKELQVADYKAETFNSKMMDIVRFYRYLKTKGHIETIPFQLDYYLKKAYPGHLDRSVEKEIYMEILERLHLVPEKPRLIFLHLWSTGLRLSEVCTLKGDAYYWDGEDAWLKIYQIKMKADKMIPIPLVLYRIMQIYIEKNHIRAKDYLFRAEQGGAYRVGTFTSYFKDFCEQNGIGGCEYIFKSHDYRHTLATRFYDDGVSIQTIRDYLGHVTEDMTKQYIDYMPKKISQANEEYFNKPGNELASAISIRRRDKQNEKPDLSI